MHDGTFTMARDFDAPLALVWRAWSDAEQMQAWWGPNGCKITAARFEFRHGGFFHYTMQFPDAPLMWGRFIYRDIVEPDRIGWLNSFSNEGCGITRAPFELSFPLEVHNEVSFVERSGTTTMSLNARPHGASADERKVFETMLSSLEQGYGGTLDQLAQHLATTGG
jgi:uncharacterized protein YndB with AHSA1/START domain